MVSVYYASPPLAGVTKLNFSTVCGLFNDIFKRRTALLCSTNHPNSSILAVLLNTKQQISALLFYFVVYTVDYPHPLVCNLFIYFFIYNGSNTHIYNSTMLPCSSFLKRLVKEGLLCVIFHF